MSDDTHVTAPVTPETAPAVHGETLWGGPRWIHNAGPEPVWVETKAEYFALLNRMGFTMKDQQESTTGPEREPVPWVPKSDAPLEPRAPKDFTAEEADILYAYKAVMQQYGLVEKLACAHCFERGERHGMRAFVSPKQIRFECRCGVVAYRPPMGTTDQAHFSNTAKVLGDRVPGTITDANGQRYLPTEILTRDAARVLRRIARLYTDRGWDPTLFCRSCWGDQATEETAITIGISAEQIALKCRCRVRFYQGHTL